MANLLPDNYWENLKASSTPTPTAQPKPTTPAPQSGNAFVNNYVKKPAQTPTAPKVDEPTKINIFGDLSLEKQEKKFGGPVGSSQYYNTIGKEGAPLGTGDTTIKGTLAKMSPVHGFGNELAKSFGYNLPMGEDWDRMSTPDKIASVTAETVAVGAKTVVSLPKTVVAMVGSLGMTAVKPFYNMLTGKKFDMDSLAKEEITKVPLIGEIPTLYQTQRTAEESGMGPIASRVFAGSDFILKTAAMLPIGEALANTFKPRPYKGTAGGLGDGQTPGTLNTQPIKMAQDADGTFRTATPGSAAEYYTMPKTEATKFGGNVKNVKWKMVPSSEAENTIAVIKNVKAKPGSYVKTEYGLKQVHQGEFGPEVTLYSAPIKSKMAPVESGPDAFALAAPAEAEPIFIIPQYRKGLENRPVTVEQITNLKQIGKSKQIDPDTQDAVVKTLTGKENIGELTEAEYVRVAQSLSKFGEKYGADNKTLGPAAYVKSILSPQRHYMSYLEDTYGYPVNSQIYQPMERAQQLVKVLDSSIQPELDGIFGKFSSPAMVEERRLIDAYVRGDKGAITSNKALDPVTQAELIQVADDLVKWDDQYGEILGVGREAYLENYGGPKIANLGGVFPQYKNLDLAPSKDFFAKFKRKGSLDPYIDDPYASRQIYIKEGSKSLHYKPVLKNFEEMKGQLPADVYRHANSYIQEKMGKLGGFEKFLDSFIPQINKKLGVNLPADATRQGISYGLSSMYSGLVGTPQAVFKQTFQLPLFVYSRLGTRFSGEALIKSVSPAERARVAKLGYLNEVSQPYGAELAKDFNPASRAGRVFKEYTQATLKPMTIVDNDIRIKTFLQAEMQWDDALNLYKDGKIQWNNLEDKLDFKAFSKSNRDIIRQKLIAGDEAGAFDTYVRDIIDETSFPYRTGSGAKIGYGMAGKLSTGLLNYTIESVSVLSKWLTTGQYEKLIRFAGTAKVMDETFKKEFGMNFSETLFQKTTGVLSPVMGIATNMYGFFESVAKGNREQMNSNKDEIVKSMKSSLPSGLLAKNVNNFFKSYNNGVDGNGQYGIYDNYGKLTRNGDFTDLFWGTLLGFPTVEKIAERNLYKDIKNSQVEEQKIKAQINQLLREGKYDEMEALINKTGVTPSSSAMESYYVPRNERMFESLSPQLKGKFVPKVYQNNQ